MDYLNDAVDAIGNLLCEAAFAGFDAAVDQHQASRATGAELRDGAVALALLGPCLNRLLQGLIGEASRKTVPRFNAYRLHPRYRRDALVSELEDAEKSFHDAILNSSGLVWPSRIFNIVVAIIRIRAVTIAIGPECIAEPAPPGQQKKSAPSLRRRKITAADIPDEIAEILLNSTNGPEHWAAAITNLAAIRGTALDVGAIATKLSALAELEDGPEIFNQIITRLLSAGYTRQTSSPAADSVMFSTGLQQLPEPPPAPAPPADPPPLASSRQMPVATTPHAEEATYSPSTPSPQRAGNEAAAPGRGADLAAKFARQARSQGDARQRLADAHAKHGRPKS
ncbi:hypothetical protein [Sphingopyxis bauzanensis]|uniref:hypothetical protein n=1 Tax=Sphingopyxis bauzanensis TaxID=651663 RepID=UPI001181C332|nr:hypothetical protein [Sphingopyxis bauzanensis]